MNTLTTCLIASFIRRSFFLSAAFFCTSVFAQQAGTSKVLSQQQLTEFAQKTEFRSGVIQNFDAKGGGSKAHVLLRNNSSVALPAGEGTWRIYFHSMREISAPETSGLRITHIKGDLNELAPTKSFSGLAPGGSYDFVYDSQGGIVGVNDFMPRAFITAPGFAPVVFSNTDTEQTTSFVDAFVKPEQQLRSSEDLYPIATAATRYQDNLAVNQIKVSTSDVAQRIIPAPKELKLHKGTASLDASWQIRYAGRLTTDAAYLKDRLKQAGLVLDSQPDNIAASGKVIEVGVSGKGEPESYTLTIEQNKILISGSDNAGAFYGIQSLLSLLPPGTASQFELPQLNIVDSPRFTWRGMEYDLARNFHGKAVTLRLVEEMARYKLNKLHLHLTEDEGWRIEIPGLPELTDVGSNRCFDLSEQSCVLTQLGTGPLKTGSGNGYFTTADFIEILKYADARHIEVVPEIDMPGHARAAIKSMQARYKKLLAAGQKTAAEQFLLSDPLDKSVYKSVQSYDDGAINVCLASTYAFAEKVIYELQQMYRKAGVKLVTFHMGGDEVGKGAWTKSPACDALFVKGEQGITGVADLKPYFVSKIAGITSIRGLDLAGWEDGLMYDPLNTFNRKQFTNERVYANAWDNIWEWGVADRAYRLANAGYQVILSPATHLYFDHPNEANAEERGYYWATRYTDLAKVFAFMPDNYYANADKTNQGAAITNLAALVGRELPALKKPENIVGMQGQVWTESIRTPEQLEQMIYPRVMALAERAWAKAAWEDDKPNVQKRLQDWAVFANTLTQKELPKIAAAGSAFYLPPPGAVIENGKLLANVAYPGLTIEYSLDKGTSWNIYSSSVAASGTVLLRSKSGTALSRTTSLAQ
jgi:hexosaminidase